VTITQSGQTVPVAVTNTIDRVYGTLTIAKALTDPAGVVDPARTFDIGYSCRYGNDDPVTGSLPLAPGASDTRTRLPIGSVCTVTEDPATLIDPPDRTQPSYVWLPESYDPGQIVTVTTDTPEPKVTVTNTVDHLTGSFGVSKTVDGTGKADGYVPGTPFEFDWTCSWPGGGDSGSFFLADGESWPGPAGTIPALATCTVTEGDIPPAGPDFGWSGPQFVISRLPEADRTANRSVTFTIPNTAGGPLEISATNTISRELGSVTVSKALTGETAGLASDAPAFQVTLGCGDAGTYELAVPAGGSASQQGIPIGVTCTVSESAPTGGLVDDSYAWGATTITPASVTVGGPDVPVTVSNDIVRVLAPVGLLKTLTGPQGIVPADAAFAGTWSCRYAGSEVAYGDWTRTAGEQDELAPAVPVTSTCTATEPLPTAPSLDPSYRFQPAVITDTTVTAGGANMITVPNTLVRDTGSVAVTKVVTGATAGYTGGQDPNFTGRGVCSVAGQPTVPPIQRAVAVANGQTLTITDVPFGWTCNAQEDSPGADLLADGSYAWGASSVDPATFTLPGDQPSITITATNPIVRAYGQLQIVKTVTDPDGVVQPGVGFAGSYSCVHGHEPAAAGRWSGGGR